MLSAATGFATTPDSIPEFKAKKPKEPKPPKSSSSNNSAAACVAYAYVIGEGTSLVTVLDTTVSPVVTLGSTAVGDTAVSAAVSATGDRLFVTDVFGTGLTALNSSVTPPAVIGTSPAMLYTIGAALSPAGDRLYTTDIVFSDAVTAFDSTVEPPAALGATLLGGSPTDIVVGAGGDRLYVNLQATGDLAVLDSSVAPPVLMTTIAVGLAPSGIALTRDGATLYVRTNDGNLTALDVTSDPPTITSVTPIGAAGAFDINPNHLALTSTDATLYVSDQLTDRVVIVDVSGAVPVAVGSIAVPGGPVGLDVSPDDTQLVVASYNGGTVSVIDLTATPPVITETLPMGLNPGSVLFGCRAGR